MRYYVALSFNLNDLPFLIPLSIGRAPVRLCLYNNEADLRSVLLALQCFHALSVVSMITELSAHCDARRVPSTQGLALASFVLVQPNKTLQVEKITAPS
jgi:hypothetical protein